MYRVFISYSHQDEDLVLRIVDILKENGLIPNWDRNFAFGAGFHEQIKNSITHAHVFLPVLTPTSDERKWIHQEIGYAMALNIPVLPIAAGKLPGEMIQQIHAVRFEGNLDELRRHLSREVIANLVQRFSATSFALFQCAQFAEDRARMMAKYCNDVLGYGVRALVRQKGGLSSLHIPDKTINHPDWKARYGKLQRSLSHCELQREERLAIEAHARFAGCKLIINPRLDYKQYGDAARMVRLKSLLEFLGSMSDDKCEVAIKSGMDHHESLTILGDWFVAESVSARIGEGYRQTIFTRHAPSMMSKIDAFDQEFREHLSACGWSDGNSRAEAIRTIEEILKTLKSSGSARGEA